MNVLTMTVFAPPDRDTFLGQQNLPSTPTHPLFANQAIAHRCCEQMRTRRVSHKRGFAPQQGDTP